MAAHEPGPDTGTDTGTSSRNGEAPATRAEIEADIAATREQLGQTVDALSQRLDIKSRTKAKASDTKQRAIAQVRSHQTLVAGAGALGLVLVGLLVWRRRR